MSEDPNTLLLPIVLKDAMKHGSDVLDSRALVGRERILQRLPTLLLETYRSRASYLVCGYRGAGKTNVANRAIERYARMLRHGEDRYKVTARRVKYDLLVSAGNRTLDYSESASEGQEKERKSPSLPRKTLARIKWWAYRSWYAAKCLTPRWNEIADYLRRRFSARVPFLGPAILKVRVNLSKEALTARDVMFEITSMLQTRVAAHSRKCFRRQVWLLVFIVAALAGYTIAPSPPSLDMESSLIGDFGAAIGSILTTPPAVGTLALTSILTLLVVACFRSARALIFTASSIAAVSIVLSGAALIASSAILAVDLSDWEAKQIEASHLLKFAAALGATLASILLVARVIRYANIYKMSYVLKRLSRHIVETREREMTIEAKPVTSKTRSSAEPLDEHKIEEALIRLLDRNSKAWSKRIDPIFIIDELDKLGIQADENAVEGTGELERLQLIEKVLRNLKHLLTVAKARFIVIAGRDMLDRFQAERRLTSSLYETLFDQYFEVPSLLTDTLVSEVAGFAAMTETYVCRRLMREEDAIAHWVEFEWSQRRERAVRDDPERSDPLIDGVDPTASPDDAARQLTIAELEKYVFRAMENGDRKLRYRPYRLPVLRRYLQAECEASNGERCDRKAMADIENTILLLRHFIHYLTFYSAGNCKKLESLFDGSVRPIANRPPRSTDWKIVRPNEKTRLFLRFSNRHQRRLIMGSMLYVAFYHHMSRQLRVGGDKLAVSTLVALHHVLKFHSFPFSRHHVEMVVNSDDAYRAHDLDHAVDTLMSMSLRGIALKVNSGLYQFRFNYAFEQEITYISRTSDLEAATYNFSLSAMEATRFRLRRELQQAYKLYGKVGVPDIAKGASVIADLNLALGDIHVVEQDLHKAERCFETACDTLRRASPMNGFDVEFGIRLIEAYLKLGLVHERRLRLDRAAAAYVSANELVRACTTVKDSGVVRLARYLECMPARRDLLMQPYLALVYLQLKRNPGGTSTGKGLPTDYLEKQRRNAPSYNYQLGEQAFYAGDFGRATTCFGDSIRRLDLSNPTIDEEDSALGSDACVAMAEAQVIARTQQIAKQLHDGEIEVGRKLTSGEQLEIVYPALKAFLTIHDGDRQHIIDHASKVTELWTFWNKRKGSKPRFTHSIVLTLIAGNHLMLRGKYYRAGVMYLRGVTLWCMLFEQFPISLLDDEEKPEGERARDKQKKEELRALWLAWRPIIAHMIKRAERNLSDSDDRAVMRFKETFLWRDAKLDTAATRAGEPQVSLRKIFLGKDLIDRNLYDSGEWREMTRSSANQIHWHDNLMVQQLIWTTVWGDMLGDFVNPLEDQPALDYIAELQQSNTPLCSTRALTFSLWLAGRRQYRQLKKAVRKRNNLKSEGADTDDVQEAEKEIMEYGTLAARNLYAATNHLKILASNDQSLMFPPQAFVFFHLWKVLYTLVAAKNREKQPAECVHAIIEVRQSLIERVKNGAPACFFDLRYVKDRALRYLRAAENMGDVTGRVRAEIIRNKFFLAGDYGDPQFHLEWTLIQSMRPTSRILQAYIKERTTDLQGEKGSDLETMWNYPTPTDPDKELEGQAAE